MDAAPGASSDREKVPVGRDIESLRVGESVLQRIGRAIPPACASLVTIAGVGILAILFSGPTSLGIPKGALHGVTPVLVITMLFGAEGLWLLVGRHPGKIQRWMAPVFAIAVAVAPALRIWMYGNEGVFLDILGQLPTWLAPAWRDLHAMTPDAMVCFSVLSLGLLAIDSSFARPIAQWLAVLLGLLALAGFVAEAYGLITQVRTAPFDLMALPVSAAFMVLAVGMLYARPQRSFARVILSDTAGGESARWLLPTAVLIPVLLGALTLEGQRIGFFTMAGASVFLVMALILLFVCMIWWNSTLLYHADMQRESIRERLRYDSTHDSLTGLANRAQFVARLEKEARRAREFDVPSALLYMDLDGFKQVNDTLGHPAGDVLLKSVAGRLAGCVRSKDLCARLGGDEFVVLLTDSPRDRVYEVAGRILETISEHYSLDGRDVVIGVSIGVALGSKDTVSAETLLKEADVALYAAKHGGKGRVHPPQ